nr:hypothetical protein [Agrobacterium deltaense]
MSCTIRFGLATPIASSMDLVWPKEARSRPPSTDAAAQGCGVDRRRS